MVEQERVHEHNYSFAAGSDKQGLTEVRWRPGQSQMWGPYSTPKAI
jgi:hypothetical protein